MVSSDEPRETTKAMTGDEAGVEVRSADEAGAGRTSGNEANVEGTSEDKAEANRTSEDKAEASGRICGKLRGASLQGKFPS